MTANRRLTAAAGAALLAAIAAELATLANLRALLSVHVFVGVLMAGPLAVKLGSTGWRFVRYHAGSPAHVREGPPRLALRMLAPLLVASTLAVVGTGFALVVTGPAQPGPFVALHVISFLVWMPTIAIHLLAHIRQVPRMVAKRLTPTGVTLGALAAATVAALLLSPAAAPWTSWMDAGHGPGGAFIVVGLVVAALGLLAALPLKLGR
ncbi:MAG TPA: hypothetical protein VOB72_16010 [Candidatus Dormibacteraeota bacterium]|nr:hypothetical protein [Candidatus Dormibacteraeota bacterium]